MKIVLVAGTRPEVIKLAPVRAAALSHPNVCVEWIATGQHTSLADQAMDMSDLRLLERKSAPLHEMAHHCTIGRPRGDYRHVLEIEDAGCGIPKEHLEQIFEPFFTTKLNSDGTGLRLNALSLHLARIEWIPEPNLSASPPS